MFWRLIFVLLTATSAFAQQQQQQPVDPVVAQKFFAIQQVFLQQERDAAIMQAAIAEVKIDQLTVEIQKLKDALEKVTSKRD